MHEYMISKGLSQLDTIANILETAHGHYIRIKFST